MLWGGGWGGRTIPCETVAMTRDCCENDPFKSVMCCRFSFRRSDKKKKKKKRNRKGSAEVVRNQIFMLANWMHNCIVGIVENTHVQILFEKI